MALADITFLIILGNAYPRIGHPIVPTFALPHVIDKLTICAFGMALAIARLALTLDLQLVGGSAP
jgi:hypothetical protein